MLIKIIKIIFIYCIFETQLREKTLPFGLITLYTLEWLVVWKSPLTTIHNDLWRLQNLKVIELTCNKIKAIPSSIGKMAHLERLNLDNNQITSVPKSLGKCPKLLEVDLSRNKLEAFPSEGFQKLEWLDISKNKIRNLPDVINWPNIKSLWALCNEIEHVQPEFCNPKLDTVNLSNNKLNKLPEEFGDITGLISLWLSENQFTEIPSCLFRYALQERKTLT